MIHTPNTALLWIFNLNIAVKCTQSNIFFRFFRENSQTNIFPVSLSLNYFKMFLLTLIQTPIYLYLPFILGFFSPSSLSIQKYQIMHQTNINYKNNTSPSDQDIRRSQLSLSYSFCQWWVFMPHKQ